jgi:hypothetical protein
VIPCELVQSSLSATTSLLPDLIVTQSCARLAKGSALES